MPNRYLRGEVYGVTLDPTAGHEQKGIRPCLIVSNNRMNESASELCVVLPITSQVRTGIPTRINLTPPEGGLNVPSQILCEQIRTVSHERIGRMWGHVHASTMADVQSILRLILAIDARQ